MSPRSRSSRDGTDHESVTACPYAPASPPAPWPAAYPPSISSRASAAYLPCVASLSTRTDTARGSSGHAGEVSSGRCAATRSVQRASATSTMPPSMAGWLLCCATSTKENSALGASRPPPRPGGVEGGVDSGIKSEARKPSAASDAPSPAALASSCAPSTVPGTAHGAGEHRQPTLRSAASSPPLELRLAPCGGGGG